MDREVKILEAINLYNGKKPQAKNKPEMEKMITAVNTIYLHVKLQKRY